MENEHKTKKQLINELIELRQRIVELEKAFNFINKQFKEFKKTATDIEKESESVSMELAISLFEVFEALKKISSGDPDVRISEESEIEIISKLKHMVNLTAENIGEIVIQSHEFAMALAEHFDVLYRVSTGELSVRVSGESKVELLEVLKKVTNEMIESIDREISERKKATKALKESEEKYRSLVESTEYSIYVVDSNCKYLFINKKHLSRMGFSDEEYLGHAYSEFHSPEETKWFLERANEVFNTGKTIRHEHLSPRDSRYFLLTFSPVKKSDGTITALTVVSKDVDELKRMAEKLRELSLTDELTSLYNRRGFFTFAEQQLKLSKRQKVGIFILYADVDNLKEINDTWGHKEGDVALIEIADILKKNYRESDIIARIGGDEFVVIPVGTAGDNVGIISDRLQKAIEIHNIKRKLKYKLSLSFGIAYYDPENPCSVDELLVQVDKLMYEKKKHKRTS